MNPASLITVPVPAPAAVDPAASVTPPPVVGKPSVGRVLLVEDEAPARLAVEMILKRAGYTVTGCAGVREAQAAVAAAAANGTAFDVVLTDLRLDGDDGLTLLDALHESHPELVGIVITGQADVQNAVRALRSGATDFLAKPFSAAELEAAMDRAMRTRRDMQAAAATQASLRDLARERGAELARVLGHLERAYQFLIESFVSLLESREREAGAHTKRVTAISLLLADALGVGDEEREIIRRGAMLHDIGKVAIPDAILHKPGPLDVEEWRVMKTHPVVGYEILRSNPYLEAVAELVYSHHEHFDGRGYPRGLRGAEIPRGARIFAVADAYDAIRAVRPYSPALPEAEAIARITMASGTQFDPEVVRALQECREEVDRIWREAAGETAGRPLPDGGMKS